MMRQKSWNQFKKTMAASTLAGAIAFTGCAVMPSVRAFADTTEQAGQVSYDNEVMPIHTDVQTEEKPLMKGTSCTVSDGKNLYYAFEMMGVRLHHERIGATHRLGVTHIHLAVGEIVSRGLKYVDSQVFRGFMGLLRVRTTRHQSQFLIRGAFENRRHASPSTNLESRKYGTNRTKIAVFNITMRVPMTRLHHRTCAIAARPAEGLC